MRTIVLIVALIALVSAQGYGGPVGGGGGGRVGGGGGYGGGGIDIGRLVNVAQGVQQVVEKARSVPKAPSARKEASAPKAPSVRKEASAPKARSVRKEASAPKARSVRKEASAPKPAPQPQPVVLPAEPAPVVRPVVVAPAATATEVDDREFKLIPVRLAAYGCDADVASLKSEVTSLATNVYKLINKVRACTGNAPIPAVTFSDPIPAPAPETTTAAAATTAAATTAAATTAAAATTTAAAATTAATTTQEGPVDVTTQAAAATTTTTTQAATTTTTATPTTTTTTARPTTTAAPLPANRYKRSGRGRLTNAAGMTCYQSSDDTSSRVTCNAASGCAPFWPPCIAVSADPSIAGQFGTTTSDGKTYGTWNGKPLYLFKDDVNPGDENGHGSGPFTAVSC